MKALPIEVVYVNGGEVYKAPTPAELSDAYLPDPDGDVEFPFRKANGKRYFLTTEIKAHFSKTAGISLDGCDLCPDVDLWTCLAATTPHERENYDLFFAMDSISQMHKVSGYYGLPMPCSDALLAEIASNPERYSLCNASGRPIVPAGIKFIDGKPTLFKLYTYPKPFGSWDVWMYGFSWWKGGKCFEAGAVYSKKTGGEVLEGAQMRMHDTEIKATLIRSERADGAVLNYEFVYGNSDPVLFWVGREMGGDGEVIRTRHYESSDFVRRMVANMTNGPTYAEFDLCPAVTFWLGRAWVEGGEQELLFAVTEGSGQLDRVAAYYGLPVPYNAEQKAVLDSKPELYRARHYDLYGRGEGQYAPVVVASVTFSEGRAIRLLLYTFMRQWEFEEQIEFPIPSN